MSRPAANLILVLTAIIWGGAFVAQSTAMEHIGPVLFTGLRFLLAAFVILPFALREGTGRLWPENRLSLPIVLAVASVFLLGQITQQVGIMGTSVTNAGFLTALYVVLVPILGILLFAQWPHPVVWPAALVALGGTWLLGGGLDGIRWGDLVVMGSASFWALHVVLIGRAVRVTERPLLVVFLQCFLGGIVATAMAFAIEPVSLAGIAEAIPELAYSGILSGGLAFSLQAIGQRYSGAAEAAIILSSEALFAAFAAALILGERLTASGALGCALILTAVVAVQLLPLRSARIGPEPASFPD